MGNSLWPERRLGDYCHQFKRLRGDSEESPPLSVTKDSGIVLQSEKFKKRIATDTRKYKVIRRGEFAYDPMSLYYRAIGRLERVSIGVVSPAYITFDIDASADRDWFTQLVRSDLALNEFIANTQGGNVHGKRKKTDWPAFCAVALPTPPLPEQKKIAAILSSVDAAVRATEAVIQQTRQVKEATRCRLLDSSLDSGQWRDIKIKDAGEVMLGRQRSPHLTDGSKTPYLRVANVLDGRIDTSDIKTMKFTGREVERYKLRPGDILLNEGQSLQLVGRSARFNGEVPGACFQNTLIRFRANSQNSGSFMAELFEWLRTTGKFAEIATQTTSIAHLGAGRFAELSVQIPELFRQEQIVSVLEAMNYSLLKGKSTLRSLRALKAGLLQDLLTGQVRVQV